MSVNDIRKAVTTDLFEVVGDGATDLLLSFICLPFPHCYFLASWVDRIHCHFYSWKRRFDLS